MKGWFRRLKREVPTFAQAAGQSLVYVWSAKLRVVLRQWRKRWQ